MVVVPLATSETETLRPPVTPRKLDSRDWIRVIAAGSLAASGVLLMAGKRRAGLVVAATGTALIVIDQQDAVRNWWNQLPGYLEEVQSVLGRVQGAVDELAVQGDRLRNILQR
jgi:hypothetical protein